MNHRPIRSVTGLLVLALLFVLATSAFAQASGGAQMRFVHAIPQAPAVDIYTDGELTIQSLDYGQVSGYVNLPAGEHRLIVTAAGELTPLWQQSVSPTSGAAVTLVAAPSSPPAFLIYQDDISPLPLGKARFTAVHAIPEAPGVDIALADGRVALPGLTFGLPGGSLDLDTGFTYDFVVVPTGQTSADAIVSPAPLTFTSGVSYALVVYGPADAPSSLLLAAPAAAEAPGGLVRVAHGVAGAPAVDIYLDDKLFAPALNFGEMTEHVALPAGDYNVALKVAGSDQTVLDAPLSIAIGDALTAAALGTPDDVTLQAFPDNVAGMDARQARLSLINGLPGSSLLTAALDDGTLLADGLAFGAANDAVSIPASAQGITLSIASGETSSTLEIPAQAFYGGVYYNLLAAGEGGEARLFVKPTGVAQGIASAPAGLAVVSAESPEAAVVAPPPAVEAAAVPPGELPIAQPIVDPGVNIQLRQYPTRTSLSLGLAPSDALLTVNGRAGVPGQDDPASFLQGNQDLPPAQVWLNVTYATPDGGFITAWVNAQFLSVGNSAGQRVRLADLPIIPFDQPGEAVNTAVTSPQIPVDRVVATVFNLDPGVNLNLRRTPSTDGEVIARVPSGTVTEFLSLLRGGEWVFVSYSPPEGGSITGWANTLYMQFSVNGKPIDFRGMDEEGLLVIADGTERGEVTANIAPIERPTVDPLLNAFIAEVALDPGSNLNLRRNPNVRSEVLAQIPSGTRLVVAGRSGDSEWLLVTFENIEGWIAARSDTAVFVRLSQNGKLVNIAQVPLVAGEVEGREPIFVEETPAPAEGQEPAPIATPTDVTYLKVIAEVVAMTVDPGGNSDGLPVLTRGRIVILLYTDGVFSAIELPNDGARGWVPANTLGPLDS
ncbi:MAG: DUF4397 domain-containing protein [Chloroflexi bacterium]|nr:DUF4397 domain-containing protein [Chloroflexota bacterium]MDL1885582.1 DUF4397 domain-containing protein [Anaerolineae bacterium CFX8]